MDYKEINYKILYYIDQFNSLISLVLFILILVFGYFLLLAPMYQDASNKIEAAKQSRQKALIEKNKTLSLLSGIFESYKKIDPLHKEKIDKILPSDDGFVPIFPQLEYIIAKNGFIINKIEGSKIEVKPSQPAGESQPSNDKNDPDASGHLGNYVLKLSISNIDYLGIKRLLGILENNIRLMDVKNLNFNPSQNKADLEIVAYYWKK